MKSAKAAMPFFELSIADRASGLEAFTRMLRCRAYLGQLCRMWFLVSVVSSDSSHGQDVELGERGRKDLLNSPVYECPVLHWTTCPKTSLLFLR